MLKSDRFIITLLTSSRLLTRLVFSALTSATLLCAAGAAEAQVVFTIGQPNVDSFPIVRTGVYVTNNGGPASLVIAQNFGVVEDGLPVGAFSLTGCGGTSSVAMAIVMDTSESMDASIGTGGLSNRSFAAFYEGISRFLASIPGPSQLALVPFANMSLYSYPGNAKNYFYSSASSTDTAQFMQRVTALEFNGKGTSVDSGIWNAASVLANSTLPRRVMILITDDAVHDAAYTQALLQAAGITLLVLEVARDSININFANRDIAVATGGDYYAAYDTNLYTPYLQAISQRIFSEHCTLRYVSNLPCPWHQKHTVQIHLNYRGNLFTENGEYLLAGATHDSIPPRLSLDTIGLLGRAVRAADPYPCESGIRSLVDSALTNLWKTFSAAGGILATDSLVVTDSMYPADGYFIATDSAGNRSRLHVHYAPRPDTHAPQFSPVQWVGSGVLTMDVAEKLPWDRGIQSIIVRPGTPNLVFDSIAYLNSHFARSYFHLINIQGSGNCCLYAQDSAGNLDTACVIWTGDTSDIFPPTFVQVPYTPVVAMMAGDVYETRLFDRGIKSVVVTPLYNSGVPWVSPLSPQRWLVSAIIADSLYAAAAMVEAYDSVGHYMRDTMWYKPQPDTAAPILVYSNTIATAFNFTASDSRAWDRGLASLIMLPTSVNVTATPPVFADAHTANFTVQVTDPTQDGTVIVEATDSVGHRADVTAIYHGFSVSPLGTSVVDFGTVAAPSLPTYTRSISVTNPNTFSASISLRPLKGDANLFRILTPSPVAFAPKQTQTLTFEFDPALLGTWSASTSFLMGDTLPMGGVTLLGKTTGQYRLALDTAAVAAPEQASVLHLSIDADPKPINLDTIAFAVTYDPDVLSLGNFSACPAGSLDTGLCLYNASWVGGVDGNRQGLLVRSNLSQVTTLSFGRSILSIPFVGHLAKDSSTVLHLTAKSSNDITAAQTSDGLVTVGSICGTPHIRYFLQGTFILHVDGIAPNPANGTVAIHLHSEAETDAVIRIISVLGSTVKEIPVHVQNGDQSITISDLPNTSGTYEVVVHAAGFDCGRQRFELLR